MAYAKLRENPSWGTRYARGIANMIPQIAGSALNSWISNAIQDYYAQQRQANKQEHEKTMLGQRFDELGGLEKARDERQERTIASTRTFPFSPAVATRMRGQEFRADSTTKTPGYEAVTRPDVFQQPGQAPSLQEYLKPPAEPRPMPMEPPQQLSPKVRDIMKDWGQEDWRREAAQAMIDAGVDPSQTGGEKSGYDLEGRKNYAAFKAKLDIKLKKIANKLAKQKISHRAAQREFELELKRLLKGEAERTGREHERGMKQWDKETDDMRLDDVAPAPAVLEQKSPIGVADLAKLWRAMPVDEQSKWKRYMDSLLPPGATPLTNMDYIQGLGSEKLRSGFNAE